jgi:nucleoside-diphosphate-sugar epimerase
MTNDRTILITGVTGQQGGAVAQALQGAGTVYALEDVAQAWKDIARNLPGVHGISPSGPGAARPKSHGKIVLRVA